MGSAGNSIRDIIQDIYERHRHLADGKLPDYIPELTRANPNWYGIAITTVDGRQYLVGDAHVPFTIQSISKPFVYGLAVESLGAAAVSRKIDVEPSGEAFNSISLKPGTGQPRNPMINAGAIAATGLIPGPGLAERFRTIQERFGDFAGRPIAMDEQVYRSESETGFRNRAIGHLLRNFNIIEGEVDPVLEAYFMQCSLLVDCQTLSVMGATLANAGVNPLTGHRVVSRATVEKVTSVMSTCGMYDYSGNWAFEVGIPAKSGVGGGIVGVLPGQLSVATFSPLLDANFNSVRGLAAFRDLSQAFGLHLLNRPSLTNYVIRRVYSLADFPSNRFRPRAAQAVLQRSGQRARVLELQGDLYFAALERVIHAYLDTPERGEFVLLDLSRIGSIDEASRAILLRFARHAAAHAQRFGLVDPGALFSPAERAALAPHAEVHDEINAAKQAIEEQILAAEAPPVHLAAEVAFEQMDLVRNLAAEDLASLQAHAELRSFPAGTRIIAQGSPPDEFYLLADGLVGIALRRDETASPREVSSFSPGMSFGELSFIQGQTRTADAVALTPVRTYALSRDAIGEFRRARPEGYQTMLQNILVSITDRLVRANREVIALR